MSSNRASNSFYSKILLFGEYSVIMNSMALSIPYHLFKGELEFGKDKSFINYELKAFGQYLQSLSSKSENGESRNNGSSELLIDTSSFLFDVGQGLYFDSTIPQGFGVGSSGALVAAVYDRYAYSKCDDLKKLKEIFSLMESHFHGSSSGVDPLISYLDSSILIDQKGSLKKLNTPSDQTGTGGIFLLNTGRPRKTEPLVNLFLEKCKNKSFEKRCQQDLIPITNACIDAFCAFDKKVLWEKFSLLSQLQYEEFNPMIPNLFKDLWLSGLDSGKFNLKLCGAGGGGFLLGLTKDFNAAQELLSQYEIRPVLRF